MGKKQKSTAAQGHLFTMDNPYGWRSVREVTKGTSIVIHEQEVKVTGVRQVGDDVYLSYPGTKDELYRTSDFVYAKL